MISFQGKSKKNNVAVNSVAKNFIAILVRHHGNDDVCFGNGRKSNLWRRRLDRVSLHEGVGQSLTLMSNKRDREPPLQIDVRFHGNSRFPRGFRLVQNRVQTSHRAHVETFPVHISCHGIRDERRGKKTKTKTGALEERVETHTGHYAFGTSSRSSNHKSFGRKSNSIPSVVRFEP